MRLLALALVALHAATWCCRPTACCSRCSASLRLFGGLQPLLRQVRATVRECDAHARIAIAPTASGAALLARMIGPGRALRWPRTAAPARCVAVAAGARGTAAAPNVWPNCCKPSAAATSATCARCRAPGCNKRGGGELLLALDRAYGDAPDPQRWFEPPERFSMPLELMHRADDAAQLSVRRQRLVQALAGWLSRQWLAASRLRLRLKLRHERRASRSDAGTSEELLIELGRPRATRRRSWRLLRERLQRHTLAAPVYAIELQLDEAVSSAGREGQLLPRPRPAGAGIPGADRSPRVAPGRRSRAAACAARRSPPRAGQCGGRCTGASGQRSRHERLHSPAPRLAAARAAASARARRRSRARLTARAAVARRAHRGRLVRRRSGLPRLPRRRGRRPSAALDLSRALRSRRRDGVVPARLVRVSANGQPSRSLRSLPGALSARGTAWQALNACRPRTRKDQADAGGRRGHAGAAAGIAGVRRAALPLELQLPDRCLASRRAGAARDATRLSRTRAHRRMLGRRRRARACRNARAGRSRCATCSASSSAANSMSRRLPTRPGCRLVLLAQQPRRLRQPVRADHLGAAAQ